MVEKTFLQVSATVVVVTVVVVFIVVVFGETGRPQDRPSKLPMIQVLYRAMSSTITLGFLMLPKFCSVFPRASA